MLAYSTLPEAQHFDQTSNGFNQIVGFCYDAAGNYNSVSTCAGGYIYNAENQITSAGGVTYTYDGDGTRVKKSNGTLYWGTGVIAESNLTGAIQREFVLLGGKRIARRELSTGAIYYYFSDHLGSSNVVTDASGVIKNESDYYPYGGERVITNTPANQNYKFTGKERDSESGLDYFGNRFYASTMGHWSSTDPVSPVSFQQSTDSTANEHFLRLISNPQQWNRYSYNLNNPLRFVDPDGQQVIGPSDIDKAINEHNLTKERDQMVNIAHDLAQQVRDHKVSSGTALDKFYSEASKLAHGDNGKALLLATGAAWKLRQSTAGRATANTISGILGHDTLHHFFVNALNNYQSALGGLVTFAANNIKDSSSDSQMGQGWGGDPDKEDRNANSAGAAFGQALSSQHAPDYATAKIGKVITDPIRPSGFIRAPGQ